MTENNELPWKKMTVLFADPNLSETYYESWIPQDDLDLEELKQNMSQIEGIQGVEYFDDHRNLIKNWHENPPEFVFNQCDDGYMNNEEFEVHLVTYMDMLNIPYTGPGCESLVIVKDKSIVRGVALSVGVPVPEEIFIDVDQDIESAVPHDMPYPTFAKLANASGSTGVISEGVANNREEAIRGLKILRTQYPERPLLLQEYLSGREISIGMAGNPECGDFELFHPVEVDYSLWNGAKVQLEEFKRDGNSQFWQDVKEVKADLTEEQLKNINDYATKMFIRTRCKDFARMDFRMDSRGNFKIMDVNPNCWLGGKFRMMAEWKGYSWPKILTKIVQSCQKRYQIKRTKDQEKLDRAKKTAEANLKKAEKVIEQ